MMMDQKWRSLRMLSMELGLGMPGYLAKPGKVRGARELN